MNHIPSFVKNFEKFKSQGVDEVLARVLLLCPQ